MLLSIMLFLPFRQCTNLAFDFKKSEKSIFDAPVLGVRYG